MDAYRVIRHPGNEEERARWACGARRQRGPVEIVSWPAPAVLRLGAHLAVRVFRGRNLFIRPLVGAASRFARRECGRGWESRVNGRRKSRTRH